MGRLSWLGYKAIASLSSFAVRGADAFNQGRGPASPLRQLRGCGAGDEWDRGIKRACLAPGTQ